MPRKKNTVKKTPARSSKKSSSKNIITPRLNRNKFLMLVLAFALVGSAAVLISRAQTAFPTSRNVYKWPFSRNSIWNMPIGSNASYTNAGIQAANAWKGEITVDPEFISVNPSSPLKTLNAPGQAGNGDQVRVPANMSHDGSWNGCATLLRADNKTVWSGQPLKLTAGGNPSWTWTTQSAPVDLKGEGVEGCHGGSHMSGIGGSIRVGELNSADPIRHALKINLYGKRFIYRGSSAADSYRWPALTPDSCWASCYAGTNPALKMGALLALRPDANLSSITNPKAKKIAEALRDYGGYLVDDTAWDVHALSVDQVVKSSGEWPSGDVAFNSQLQEVFKMLAVVTNNSPTSIGGGGTPRAPLAPCFDDEPTCVNVPPTTTPTTPTTNTTVDPSWTAINDNTTGTIPGQFEYSGNWAYGSGGTFNRYLSDDHYTNTSGASYTVRFTGTQARIYATKANNHGIVGISVDGGAETTVDTYNSTRADQSLIYTTPVLPYGTHTVKVRITGSKNSASTGTYVTADKVEYTGTAPVTPISWVGVNDNTKGTALGQFQFSGTWTRGNNGQFNQFQKDDHYTSAKDASYTVRFSGTQTKLYLTKAKNHGIVGVSIDGGTETMVDTYSATREDQALVFTSPVLTNGEHTIRVRITGNKNAASSGTFATADKVEYR